MIRRELFEFLTQRFQQPVVVVHDERDGLLSLPTVFCHRLDDELEGGLDFVALTVVDESLQPIADVHLGVILSVSRQQHVAQYRGATESVFVDFAAVVDADLLQVSNQVLGQWNVVRVSALDVAAAVARELVWTQRLENIDEGRQQLSRVLKQGFACVDRQLFRISFGVRRRAGNRAGHHLRLRGQRHKWLRLGLMVLRSRIDESREKRSSHVGSVPRLLLEL